MRNVVLLSLGFAIFCNAYCGNTSERNTNEINAQMTWHLSAGNLPLGIPLTDDHTSKSCTFTKDNRKKIAKRERVKINNYNHNISHNKDSYNKRHRK